MLSDILHSIRALLQVWMERVSDLEGTVSGTLCEHDAVLEAIRAHDPDAANEAMAEHMRMANARLRESIGADEQPAGRLTAANRPSLKAGYPVPPRSRSVPAAHSPGPAPPFSQHSAADVIAVIPAGSAVRTSGANSGEWLGGRAASFSSAEPGVRAQVRGPTVPNIQ